MDGPGSLEAGGWDTEVGVERLASNEFGFRCAGSVEAGWSFFGFGGNNEAEWGGDEMTLAEDRDFQNSESSKLISFRLDFGSGGPSGGEKSNDWPHLICSNGLWICWKLIESPNLHSLG